MRRSTSRTDTDAPEVSAPAGLLAFDLDGTIVEATPEGQFVAEKALVAGLLTELAHWQAQGWASVVITARLAEPIFVRQLRPVAVSRCYGTVIDLCVGHSKRPHQRQPLRRHTLGPALSAQVMAQLSEADLHHQVSRSHVSGPQHGWRNDGQGRYSHFAQVPEVVKIYHQRQEQSLLQASRIAQILEHWQAIAGVQVIHEHPYTVAAVATGGDKGSGLAYMARHFGVPLHRVIAFGDGSSDAAMLEVLRQGGGQFVRVGEHAALAEAQHSVATPQQVPQMLRSLRW